MPKRDTRAHHISFTHPPALSTVTSQATPFPACPEAGALHITPEAREMPGNEAVEGEKEHGGRQKPKGLTHI